MALTASDTLVVCDGNNSQLRRLDPTNGNVTTIDLPIESSRGVTIGSDGTLYLADYGGLCEISSDDALSRLASNMPTFGLGDCLLNCCHLDEPSGLLYVATANQIYAVPIHTAGERRATRMF